MLLNGRPARECSVVEIGCGAGRMTEWFSREFGTVFALDVSPEMIQLARERLSARHNVMLHPINGCDLAPLASESADLVFSYIVFQHIPSREAIASLFREAARVVRPGGKVKIQVNGDQSDAYRSHVPDTWLGQTYSVGEAEGLLHNAGLTPIASEGARTPYYTITSAKGDAPPRGACVLAGEPWSSAWLADGFGEPVDRSWRPIGPRARVRLEGGGGRVYAGLYFWPESYRHTFSIGTGRFEVTAPGDVYFEYEKEGNDLLLGLDPPPVKAPAFRVIGSY